MKNPFDGLKTKYQGLLDSCIEMPCANCDATTRLPAERVAKIWEDDEGREIVALDQSIEILCDECADRKHTAGLHQRRLHESDMPLSALEFAPKRDLRLDRGAYIWGPQGSGKTTYACHLLAAFIKDSQQRGRFVSVADLLFRARGHEAYEYVEGVSRIPHVVLDDIDKGNFTEEARAVLFEVIRQREEKKLTTIITGNVNLNDLSRITSQAIASRINGMCRIVKIEGADMRKGKS